MKRLPAALAALVLSLTTSAAGQTAVRANGAARNAPAPHEWTPVRAVDDSAFMAGFRWRSVGPANVDGRVTDIEGVPSPSKTFYVAAATGGIWKTTNNGTTFRPVFDHERVVSMGDLAIAPSDTSIIWAGTGEEDSRNSISPGGGVYKSTDGGMTWKLMGLEATQSIGRIVVHPTNPDIVYVAALGHPWGANPERGLYKTTDGGETWKRIKFVSDEAGFVDIAMNPTNPDVLFASSWERVRTPYSLQSGGPGSALWKSTDAGATWTEVRGGGFPEGMKGRIGIAIAPSDPKVVYALVEAEKPATEEEAPKSGAEAGEPAAEPEPGEPGAEAGEHAEEPQAEEPEGAGGTGLYRSEDGGVTWKFMNDNDSRPFYYSQVRVDPSDPNRVIWSSTPVNFSKDGGKTVGQATQGIHVDQHALWWDPGDPDHFIIGNDGGIAVTWDKGGNYDFINTLPIGQFYEVSYNMAIPYRVCGGLQDNGTWCGPSRRASGGIDNHMWATVNGGDGFYSAQDPTDPRIVYAESQGGSMARVNVATGERKFLVKPDWREKAKALRDSLVVLRGDTTKAVAPEVQRRIDALRARVVQDSIKYDLRYNWNTPLILSPHSPITLYAGGNRVLKSTNRGDDFEVISPDLTTADTMKIRISTKTTGGITRDVTGAETYGTIVALAESPLRQGLLFAGTDDGNVWMSPDDGGRWTDLGGRFPGLPPGTWVSRIEPSHHDVNTFYVAFDGHRADDFTPYLYVTTDGGRKFRSIAGGLPTGGPDFLHVVREDPFNPDLLFVGTDVGLYMSLDRGASWRRFMEGMPTVPVHDLQIHPRDRELIAGTHGRSVWIVDIAPLEQLQDGMLAGPTLFAPPPALEFGDRPVGGETPGHRTFRGASAPYGAEFAYWVPEGFELAGPVAASETDAKEDEGVARSAGGAGREQAGPEREQAGAGARPAGRGDFHGRGRGGRRGPQLTFAVLDAAGDTVQTVTGPATPGLHRIAWNLRRRPAPRVLSPSERQDSVRNARFMRAIADSLAEAGTSRAMLDRVLGLIESGNRQAIFRAFGGGGRRTPGQFVERPGETYPGQGRQTAGRGGAGAGKPGAAAAARGGPGGGAGGPGGESMRDVMRKIFRAMRDRGRGFGFGGRGRNQGDRASPGDYTVALRLGDVTLSRPLPVVRAPSLAATGSSAGGAGRH
ncbi:MAG: WD40/YVTN/BNR-like repeat-containing protein [Gemmatimonadota bacterium]